MLFVGVVLAAVVGILWVSRDYEDWEAFGTGGTPTNCKGYLKMRRVWLKRLFLNDNLRDASSLPDIGPTYLTRPMSRRKGGRPEMMPRTLPHRQKPAGIHPEAKNRLHSLVAKLHLQHPQLLTLAPSKTEGGTADAIYAQHDLLTLNSAAAAVGYEVAHSHRSDNSLHLFLSPRDAKTVIESDWAERFPVKELGPPGWVMVYAPRGDEEVETVEAIVKAAVGWVTGVRI